jgi:hypothetical protein
MGKFDAIQLTSAEHSKAKGLEESIRLGGMHGTR